MSNVLPFPIVLGSPPKPIAPAVPAPAPTCRFAGSVNEVLVAQAALTTHSDKQAIAANLIETRKFIIVARPSLSFLPETQLFWTSRSNYTTNDSTLKSVCKIHLNQLLTDSANPERKAGAA